MKIFVLLLLLLFSSCTVADKNNAENSSDVDIESGASADATTSASIIPTKYYSYFTPSGFSSSAKKKALFIVADPRKDSVNYDLAKTAMQYLEENNIEVELRDLYDMKWNPILWLSEFFYQKDGKGSPPIDVKTEQDFVSKADYLVFSYPNWHDTPNVMAKGYIERVFALRFAYKFVNGQHLGLLDGKQLYTIMNAGGLGGGRGWIGDQIENPPVQPIKWDDYMNAFKVIDDDLALWWGMKNLGRFVNDQTPANVIDYNNQADYERYSKEIEILRQDLRRHIKNVFKL